MAGLEAHGYARGRDGGVREELAVGVVQFKPTTEVKATSILPSLNGKTSRSWRGIVPFTHLAREGRMTVTIGRRELLAALGGGASAWPLAARAAAGLTRFEDEISMNRRRCPAGALHAHPQEMVEEQVAR